MIVVSDTSPLMNLAVVEHLHLLHQLYDTVLIPDAVWNELSMLSAHHPEVTDVHTLSWLERQPVTSRSVVNALQAELDICVAYARSQPIVREIICPQHGL